MASPLQDRTRYEPAEVEPRVLERWLAAGYFHPQPAGTPADTYSIAIPPPNITGVLHMGHALNAAIQDVLIRHQRMQGRPAKWIFGTDHAGIATQTQVEKLLASEGTSREAIGREAFEQRVWDWRQRYGRTIVSQFQRLGASCDYEDERFTLDEAYVAAVGRVFKTLYDKGLIYRDNYMVNWDPGTRSAISDLEVEEREVTDTLYYIDYPLEEGDETITVATVRPETMLGDTAVAVHPADERYVHLIGRWVTLPLAGRRLRVISDPYVRPEFGTGALKITPGHDPNDFEIGRRHELEAINVIGEDGRMTEAAGPLFAGLPVGEAARAVVAALKEEGRISRSEPYTHAVPFSHRSGERIEPLISLQWFMRMDELAQPAIAAVRSGRLTFRPERWGRVYLDWLENIRPWCISRQLWWGHRLPVWYCDSCDETYVALEAPARCGACSGDLRRDEDVLDTWFSSGLWPFATLGWPADTPELRSFYPTDVLVTARDIIFLWVARMVMMGVEFTGSEPFGDVFITPIIQAPDGRRMSKSLGTGIDPLDEIEAHGADAVRFGLLAMASSQDVRYSAEKVQQGQQFANKMWNASRLVLLNVAAAEPGARPQTIEDRWICSRLQRAIERVEELIGRYDFAHAAQELYGFFWNELCDWYLEMVKPRLYGEPDSDLSATMLYLLRQTLALAHPFMPFVTEEINSFVPGAEGDLAAGPFPRPDPALLDADAERQVEAVIDTVRRLRNYRDSLGIAAGTQVAARLVADDPPARERFERSRESIERLARYRLEVTDRSSDGIAEDAPSVPIDGGTAVLLESGEANAGEARARLEARAGQLRAEIARARKKLGNSGFTAKAPAQIVEAEREKLQRFEGELAELES